MRVLNASSLNFTPPEAREALTSRVWSPGAVTEMLARAGHVSTRPDDASADFGPGPEGYRLSAVQAQAILDLRLQRLTGLEQDKIINEYQELLSRIREYTEILADPEKSVTTTPMPGVRKSSRTTRAWRWKT